ncbi:MAG: MalY/PatB family protein [Candidatus Enterenecus sp.]
MQSQFDRPVPPRIGMESDKWDMMGKGRDPSIVPLSVADMEFLSPPQIVTALEETARFGMWGYTGWGDRYYNALHNWMRDRHGIEISRDWVVRVNGVVQGLGAAVRALTKPGDTILIQPPVYPPFFRVVRDNGRVLAESPLKRTAAGYEMDFEDLERQLARPEVTAMLLCSPHNPVGRVWTEEELRRLAELCLENHVLVISDEIHSDLVQKDHPHTVFASLGEAHARNCVIGTAASKTFSLAGLCCANMLVPDPEKKRALEAETARSGCTTHSTFGTVALEVGYTQCGPWLDELLDYVRGNYDYLKDFLARHFPALWLSPMEGTYLAWIDFAALEPDQEKRARFLGEDAQLFLSHGAPFGAPTFERVNLACTRAVLAAALDRLLSAAQARGLV